MLTSKFDFPWCTGGSRLTHVDDGWYTRKHRLEMYELPPPAPFCMCQKERLLLGCRTLLCAHLSEQTGNGAEEHSSRKSYVYTRVVCVTTTAAVHGADSGAVLETIVT